jgi:Nucleotidyl transferase AbiEii toxin, Type IV TA system
MSVTYKPPSSPPPSAGVLAKYVLAYARASNLAEGRARATKDLDVALHHTDADLAVTLERALTSEPYQGFSFRTKRPPLVLDNGVVNMEFAVSYRGGAWASISIDVARNESGEHEIEWLPAIPLTDTFGVTGPNALPCLPLCHHIAQKLHGMTLPPPRPGKRNERFRDLIDLLLMESLVVEYGELRKTCEHVFETRGTHPWPPPLDLPGHWIDPINRLIGELELPIADAHAGLVRVRQFVDRILSSAAVIDGNLR